MAAGLAVILGACSSQQQSDVAKTTPNPFFTEYTTPFGVPPFDQIEVAHYKPALLKGMEEHVKEVEAIVSNPEEPTFENTIVALDQCGQLLEKVMAINLMIHQVAQSNHGRHQTGRHDQLIERPHHRPMTDPLREEIDRNNDTQRTAVAGQTALPDLQDLHRIRQIVVGRIEEAMPQARANHRA